MHVDLKKRNLSPKIIKLYTSCSTLQSLLFYFKEFNYSAVHKCRFELTRTYCWFDDYRPVIVIIDLRCTIPIKSQSLRTEVPWPNLKKSDHYLVQTLKLICTCYFNLNTFVFLLGFYNQDTKIGTGIYEYDL